VTNQSNILSFLLALLALSLWQASSVVCASQPNIVIIYADDLGFGDVQCYNLERGKIPTPNIDQLADRGMRFTDGHSSSGVCSPSRYTILTGRYHWRTRLQSGIVSLWGKPVITPDRITIGSLAKQCGYHTACIGKWHLGWNWPIDDADKELFRTTGYNGKKDLIATAEHQQAWEKAFSQPIGGGPIAVGFDEYFGTDVPNWPPYCFIKNDRTVGIPSEFANPSLFVKNQASQQGPAVSNWTLEPILPNLATQACDYIDRRANADKPFLLYLPLTSPHTPLSVNKPWIGKSGLSRYADFVMETDAVVGQVMNALQNHQIHKSTLVIFTSDNGCAPYINVDELEKQGHYPSGPLRGYKADAWEGGHRVPFIVRWDGVIQPGSTCDALVHQADLIATFAEILQQQLPDQAAEDSFSILSLLKGSDQAVRQTAVSCSIKGIPSIRNGKWKYIPAPGSGGWGKGGDQSQPHQLYNLEEDIGEAHNLASSEPARVKEMQELLERQITEGRSTPGVRQSNDIRVQRHVVTQK
jgi:arylsulfatase A